MKKIVRLLTVTITLLLLLQGCDSNKKIQVAPENDPALHIECYKELTALYGTERLQVLEALNCSVEDADVENWDAIGVPLDSSYAGVEFGTCRLWFRNSSLYRVTCEKSYSYPDELDQAVEDASAMAMRLAQDLGLPHQVDTWNDYLEEKYQVEMDSETPTYRDPEQIRDMLNNNTGGCIMWWDMTSVALPEVRNSIMQFGEDARYAFYLCVSRCDDEIRLELCF